MNIAEIFAKYDPSQITIGVLGGHSALDVCHGAKQHGFRTVAVCQKGRTQTYAKYYKTRIKNGQQVGCIDHVIEVEKFGDVVLPEVQQQLRDLNCVFVHNRYFWTYCDFEKVEHEFKVPIYGSRKLIRLEERDVPKNQYWLLEQAGIRIPKMFSIPKLQKMGPMVGFAEEPQEDIDRLTLTKVNNAVRTYERENFVAKDWAQWLEIVNNKITDGLITFEDIQVAVVEEFILGAQINFNYFYDPITDELELMGTDMRRQTNLDGVLRLPAHQQLLVDDLMTYVKHIETGHVAITCKESLLEKAFIAGENFIAACKKHAPEPLIGPFALQGAIDTANNKEELVVFDVSFRIPGSPGTRFTPYSGYKYGESLSFGQRIGMHIQEALDAGNLEKLLT